MLVCDEEGWLGEVCYKFVYRVLLQEWLKDKSQGVTGTEERITVPQLLRYPDVSTKIKQQYQLQFVVHT